MGTLGMELNFFPFMLTNLISYGMFLRFKWTQYDDVYKFGIEY